MFHHHGLQCCSINSEEKPFKFAALSYVWGKTLFIQSSAWRSCLPPETPHTSVSHRSDSKSLRPSEG